MKILNIVIVSLFLCLKCWGQASITGVVNYITSTGGNEFAPDVVVRLFDMKKLPANFNLNDIVDYKSTLPIFNKSSFHKINFKTIEERREYENKMALEKEQVKANDKYLMSIGINTESAMNDRMTKCYKQITSTYTAHGERTTTNYKGEYKFDCPPGEYLIIVNRPYDKSGGALDEYYKIILSEGEVKKIESTFHII